MAEGSLNDRELVRRCLRKDEDAWRMLIEKYHRRVYNLCYQFFGRAGRAQDMTQEVFLKLYNSLGRFKFDMEFSTWIMAVARNLCIDAYRKEKKSMFANLEEADRVPAPAEASPLAELERKDAYSQVHDALVRVSEDLRMAVILRDIQGCSYDEIAGITEVPIGTVKSRINRGRLELARVLMTARAAKEEGA